MLADDVAVDVVVGPPTGPGTALARGRVTVLRLAWRRSDPLAVTLQLTSKPDHPALPQGRWVVLRDFLRYGLEEPTGDGAVRLLPDEDADRVCLQLATDGRPVGVSAPRSVLRDFLDQTERVIPAGEERSEEALESLIAQLLDR